MLCIGPVKQFVLHPNVDKLVANGKKIFLNSPARIELFKKNKAPDTPLPPIPVITRWEILLDVTVYYAEYFEIFCSMVNELDRDDASSMQHCKTCLRTQIN
jgi:hypothetical protein